MNKNINVSLIVTLLLIVGIPSIIRYRQFNQEQKCYKSQVEELSSFATNTEKTVSNLMSDYYRNVYESKDVDRISEQQLIATEYSLVLLGEMYKQNIDVTKILVNLTICSSYSW